MIERLTPETWQLIAVIALACFSAGCLSTGAVLLWRERREQRAKWLRDKIDQINGKREDERE